MSRRRSHASSLDTTLARVLADSRSRAPPPLPADFEAFPPLPLHRPQARRAATPTELLTPPSSPSPEDQPNGRMGAQQRSQSSSRPLSLAPSSSSPPRLFPTFDDFLPALRLGATHDPSEVEFPARFEPFFDPPSPDSDSDYSFPAFAFSHSSSDSPWCSSTSSHSHALPPTPPRTPVQHFTPPELHLIASLHSGRLPSIAQTSPPSSPEGPIINTGNSGPMLVQEGDWKCGACGFVVRPFPSTPSLQLT